MSMRKLWHRYPRRNFSCRFFVLVNRLSGCANKTTEGHATPTQSPLPYIQSVTKSPPVLVLSGYRLRGEGGTNRENAEIFYTGETILSNTKMVDTGRHSVHLSKPRERTPRVSPNVNYRLWVTTMCRYRFIDCSKCTTPGQDIDSGEGCACVRARSTWETSVPSDEFCYKLKTTL